MYALKQPALRRAIGYARVSTDTQEREGSSLTTQSREIIEYCKANGLELVAPIFKEVQSAGSASKRKIFQEAIRHLLNNKSDVLVFSNWDRFARNPIDNELIRRHLNKKGKQLISTQQRYLQAREDEEEDEELEAALAHIAVDNEKERKKIRKRLVKGANYKKALGGYVGGRPPYEYDVIRGELVLNQERWQTIKKIKRLRTWLDWDMSRIADYLNNEKVPGYSLRNSLRPSDRRSIRIAPDPTATWQYHTIRKIMQTWNDGTRQAWHDEYEAKRIAREVRR